MEKNLNKLHIQGKVVKDLEYSHTTAGEMFFKFVVGVQRMSSVVDEIPVYISERVPGIIKIQDQELIVLDGQLRSRREEVDGRSEHYVYMFATEATDEVKTAIPNEINIEGYVCKPVVVRETPQGRTVADLLIAVNRGNGKSDYLPCITWGRNAHFAESLNVGTHILAKGRLQSRNYQKSTDNETITKTAYEVSISLLQVISEG
jgi:single-stranded DNA-binding protein